jgi:hypothetical protein
LNQLDQNFDRAPTGLPGVQVNAAYLWVGQLEHAAVNGAAQAKLVRDDQL